MRNLVKKFPLLLKEGCHDEGVTGWLIRSENRLVFKEPELLKKEIRITFKRKDSEFE
jgi:hypothetical protein